MLICGKESTIIVFTSSERDYKRLQQQFLHNKCAVSHITTLLCNISTILFWVYNTSYHDAMEKNSQLAGKKAILMWSAALTY